MIVRRIFLVFLLLTCFSGPCLALETQFETGFLTTWWKNDNHDKGLQVAIPLQAGVTYDAFKAQLLNAYVHTTVDPANSEKATLNHFLDTKLNFSYEMTGRLPLDLLVGCGFNLPTGYTDLSNQQLVLVSLPPDLMPITTFGEGLNINPYLAVSKEWTKVVAGFGLGYLQRGKYDYSETIQDYDPGDILTVSASMEYDFTAALQGKLFGEYANYGKDTLASDDYYQDGALKLIGIGLTYALPAWEIGASIHGIFRAKGKYYMDTATPIEEKKNHGNEWEGSLNYRYFLNRSTTLTSGLDYLTSAANNYPSGSYSYAGKRVKITLAGGIERSLTKKTKGTLGLNLFSMQDDRNWYHPGDDYRYTGFTLDARVTTRY